MNACSSILMRTAARWCLLVALSAAAYGAKAQVAQELVPMVDLSRILGIVDPTQELVALNAAPLPRLNRAEAEPAVLPEPKTWFVPMQSQGSERILRISGETSVAHLVLYLPDLGTPKTLYLSYRTSVDVLPERSQLRISVNGVQTAPVVPVSSDQFQKLMLDPSLLVQGRNEIDVAVSQAHRISCGPKASFQLWSEFDLNASGLDLSSEAFGLNATTFKAALMSQVASGRGVALRGSADVSKAALADLAIRLSGIAGGGGGWIRLENGYGPNKAGHDLLRIQVVTAASPSVTLRKGAGGTIVLVLALAQGFDMAALLDAYLPQPTLSNDLPPLPVGATATLESLGFADTADANHYIRHDLNLRLPSDWLILASQRANLTLLYSFAANLPKGSLLMVKVNETTIQALPLDQNGGSLRPPLDISFPARLLHPGANALTFEATIPADPSDLPCNTGTDPHLTIFGKSALTVPKAPAMRFAGMGPTLLGLPQTAIVASALGAGQADVLADAGALATISQMRPLVGQPVLEGARLSVVSLQSASEIPLAGLGVSLRDLGALLPVADAPKNAPADGNQTTEQGLWNQAAGRLQDLVQAVLGMAQPGDPALQDWLQQRTGDAVLMLPDAAKPAQLWLVIGPSADPVKVAKAVAKARIDPNGPQGQVAVLTAKGDWEDWRPMTSAPVLQEPLTLANFRFVAGTYASWSPLYFVLALLGLTALSVLFGLIFVVSTRGERK